MPTLRRAAGTLGALALAALLPLSGLVATPAVAHPGHGGPVPADPAAEAALDWDNYERILLTKDTGEPIDLAVLPDGAVLHTARDGVVRLTEPDLGTTRQIARFDVYANSEDGLQTIGVDPDFEENGWVYVFYAPRVMSGLAENGRPYVTTTAAGSAPTVLPAGESDETYWHQWLGYNQLSRVQWDEGSRTLDLATEQVVMKVEVQRGQCCHVGGDFGFDDEGHIYVATGDNTPAGTPGANGFAPNNDAPGMNPGLDARRGAGSTNDLRGKILRVTVAADGSYTVPEGNMFAPGTEGTRPEIFAMGLRNPFRMEVDARTGSVSWGDYGPDAGAANPQRGPMGLVEWQTVGLDQPVNAGWPYCTGDQANYNDWDFETATPGPWFDCDAGPLNTSRWNTGLAQTPPATPATLWYGDSTGDQPWPELTDLGAGSGQGPMGGPVYHHDPAGTSPTAFPAYWDRHAFFGEFSQDYVAVFDVQWPSGPVDGIQDFLPNSHLRNALQPVWDNPMDLEFGPDGSLYVLDYGDGFFRANPDAGLYRVDWAPGNKTPQPRIVADPVSSSEAPLTVTLDATTSTDPDGDALTYEWDVDGDGVVDATGATVTYTYTERGGYTVILRATDPGGKTGLTSTTVSVGNVAPTVDVQFPPDGGFFTWGDRIPFRITTDDAEDGTATICSRVRWTFGLGHAEHAHPEVLGTGCTGTWNTPADAPEHGETEKLYGVVVVSYSDAGADGLPPATGETTLTLNPDVLEAEHADSSSGVEVVTDPTAGALSRVTSLDPGDWIANDPVDFYGVEAVTTRATGEGQLQFRWGAPDAEPFAVVDVPAGAGWQDVTTPLVDAPVGTGEWFVTSTGGVDVDRFSVVGAGVMTPQAPFVSAGTTPALPDGENGWWTGPVTVQIGTGGIDVTAVQWSADGGATWNDVRNPNGNVRAFQVTSEGTTDILYRALDAAGRSSQGSLQVRIDSQAPTVALGGVEAGAVYGDSAVLAPTAPAQDATSGVASVVATLAGEPVELDVPLELWSLPLGTHDLVVTATDVAGLATSSTVTFTIDTSTDDLAVLLDRFEARGDLGRRGANQLTIRLAVVMRHEDAGRTTQAARSLRAFATTAGNRAYVPDPAVRAVLVRDAEHLIQEWTP